MFYLRPPKLPPLLWPPPPTLPPLRPPPNEEWLPPPNEPELLGVERGVKLLAELELEPPPNELVLLRLLPNERLVELPPNVPVLLRLPNELPLRFPPKFERSRVTVVRVLLCGRLFMFCGRLLLVEVRLPNWGVLVRLMLPKLCPRPKSPRLKPSRMPILC